MTLARRAISPAALKFNLSKSNGDISKELGDGGFVKDLEKKGLGKGGRKWFSSLALIF